MDLQDGDLVVARVAAPDVLDAGRSARLVETIEFALKEKCHYLINNIRQDLLLPEWNLRKKWAWKDGVL